MSQMLFIKEYWGEGSYQFKSVRTGKYLARLRVAGRKAENGTDRGRPGGSVDWFVMEISTWSRRRMAALC